MKGAFPFSEWNFDCSVLCKRTYHGRKSRASGVVMARMGATRVIVFLILGACTALCQQSNAKMGGANGLPDAPSAHTTAITEEPREFSDTVRPPLGTLTSAEQNPALRFNLGRFDAEEAARSGKTFVRTLLPLRPIGSYHASNRDSFMGRTVDAASSFVVTRDADGKRRVNVPYLITVLSSAVAHSAYRPYWRRSATQPFADFGSTVGSDAGMNVFHEFQPGITHLMKSHEPKFVSRIAEKGR